ncbi:MAG: GntR family transcriptional regulator [Bacteroidetes bacterium]|nr:GntR family transcriptional regulator [Bacteroidota bacterium]
MIEIDRSSEIPIHTQVANAIRFKIGNGNYRMGDKLPPTRTLASHIGISFHTVRKAYLDLAQAGIIVARSGSGYVVQNAEPLSKSERMERGASLLSNALRQAVGLGLDEEEIEYLFAEQLQQLDASESTSKIVVAAPYKELGQACAIQIAGAFQRECHSCSLDELGKHADADLVIVPFRNVKQVLSMGMRSDVIGIAYELDEDALSQISRMMDSETLGLVTRYSDAVASLTTELRSLTRWAGPVVAVSVEEGDSYLASLIRECDVMVYTQGAERAVRPFLERAKRHVRLALKLAESSIERIRGVIP